MSLSCSKPAWSCSWWAELGCNITIMKNTACLQTIQNLDIMRFVLLSQIMRDNCEWHQIACYCEIPFKETCCKITFFFQISLWHWAICCGITIICVGLHFKTLSQTWYCINILIIYIIPSQEGGANRKTVNLLVRKMKNWYLLVWTIHWEDTWSCWHKSQRVTCHITNHKSPPASASNNSSL